MGIINWIKEKIGANTERAPSDEEFYKIMTERLSELSIRELAFWTCVNLIANMICKCEFKTYLGGKEVKGAEYYLWNIEPNKNQNSSVFLRKMISNLYRNNEVLIVECDAQLLVADSYIKKPYALYEDVFSQVQVGDFTFNRTFLQSEVLYITLSDKKIQSLIGIMYETYSKLIGYSIKAYEKSRGNRGIINIEAIASGDKNFDTRFKKLMEQDFKKFFEENNAVLPLFEGYKYDELSQKTYSSESTRDIRSMIDDVYDITARAFQIPPLLISGQVEGIKDATDQFLTACIDPLTDLISEEINRKRYGYSEFAKGNYLKIDTKAVKHIDILDVSTAVDKLIASGAFTINDIRKTVGEELIDEPWANQHFMTKNYQSIDEILNPLLEGGE